MSKNFLLESAGMLKQVSSETAAEYDRKAKNLICCINAMMTGRPDIENLIGKNNLNLMRDNHASHVRFIASMLKNPNPYVLVEKVLWIFRAYRSNGFTISCWAAQVNTWMIVLHDELSDAAFSEILPYYEWMQVNIPLFIWVSDKKPEPQYSLN